MELRRTVVFDGPDRSGKSTIARLLARETGLTYFKHARDKVEASSGSDYSRLMLSYGDPYFVDFLAQTGTCVVIDRHWPAEFVYSKLHGRPTDAEALRR